MKRWQEYKSSKEAAEEKTGMDLDKDSERGESLDHKKKVNLAKRKMIDFFEARKNGALKIAHGEANKGEPVELTNWHFKAKNQPYSEVISAIKSNKSKQFFLNKFNNLLRQIKPTMNQKLFQEKIGELEVWGEALIKLFNF